ncbi:protein kinase [Streptomyces griseiscabiei]|uniref:Phthiocerol/phthiodiolone dimycocerosyl transferase n=1 Tax=Streptomyces griseiscabiei TaxID=2993540 RepID=A0ABU4L3P9_9ACTN|nr:protein kinase [Streptomyces griseiscabiei]MBZ3906094.1 protein kinase [Streptomyces griseiscabiei]MDX2909728.1 protein kinase [Streptomyces griseiscabiei]
MRRALCPVENIYVAQRSRALLSCALHGPVDPAVLAAAFDAVTAEQPLLLTRIVPDGDGDGDGHALELLPEAERPRLRVRTGGEEVYAEELNTPLTVGGPLTRAVLVTDPGEERHTLYLSIDHVIADGHSAVALLNTIWDRYRERMGGTPAPLPPVAGFPDPVSTLLPPSDAADTEKHLEQRVEQIGRHPAELVPYDVKPAPAASGEPHGATPGEPHRIEVRRLLLDTGQTARLRERARAEGVSVHSLISAAVLLAARRRLDGDAGPRPLGCLSPVDLRSRLSPPVPATVIVAAVTMHLQILPVGQESDVLELAREVGDGLRDFLDRGAHFQETRIMPSTRTHPTLHLGTVIVTNMGPVPGPRLPEGTRVTDVRLAPARENYFPQAGRSPVMACVATFDGRLGIELPHHTACFSRPFMRELAGEVRTTLLALAKSDEEPHPATAV